MNEFRTIVHARNATNVAGDVVLNALASRA
jgi:hypothetical protein